MTILKHSPWLGEFYERRDISVKFVIKETPVKSFILYEILEASLYQSEYVLILAFNSCE